MASDDYDVVVFKLLSCLYACLKQGVEPNTVKAQEVAGCNDIYVRPPVCVHPFARPCP